MYLWNIISLYAFSGNVFCKYNVKNRKLYTYEFEVNVGLLSKYFLEQLEF